MASKSTINLVRYYFYKGFQMDSARRERLVALAYETARDQKLFPSKILIRSGLHDTTSAGGGYFKKDPDGWHLTMAFKDNELDKMGNHVASHGYTKGKNDFVLVKATHGEVKSDDTPRGQDKVVWPEEEDLEEFITIAYSHLPEH